MLRDAVLAFNRGLISRLGLARADIKRMALAAETMTNWLPRVLGSMSIRPGLGYIGATKTNQAARMIPFKFSASDTALLEFTPYLMRVWKDETLISRTSVTTQVEKADFSVAQQTSGATITIASPAVVTVADEFFKDGDQVSFTTSGALPTGLTVGTIYYVVNYGVDGALKFRVALTSGGADINTSGTQSGTHLAETYEYISGWSDNDESGAASQWTEINVWSGGVAIPIGVLQFSGDGTNAAIRDQTVTVAAADQSVEHSLDIFIYRGPITLRVGTSVSDEVTLSITSPGVVTYTGDDNWSDDDQVVFTTSGELPTGLSVDTVYYVVNYAVDGAKKFRVSLTEGGADINFTGSEYGTHRAHIYPNDDSYINEVDLEAGRHNLTFTPTDDFNIRWQSRLEHDVHLGSCSIGTSGTLEIATDYGADDLANLRYDQSGDIVFLASPDYRQTLIKRRSNDSWSIVDYLADDGPFRATNGGPITLTPSAIIGNITLTASAELFRITSIGGLYKLVSSGQNVIVTASAQNTFTDPIRVTGVDASRPFTIVVDGTIAASTVTLQRSLTAETGPWEDTTQTWTATTVETYDDGLDNQIVWYRIGIKTGDYGGADSVDLTLNYELGAIVGVCRVTDYTSSTVVSAEVLKDLGDNVATDNWAEGSWSDRRGWPSAVAFHENRLWWAGKGEVWGSVSNAFDSYDDTVEGDIGPINRLVATGGTDTINWLVSVQRLLAGAQEQEYSGKSSSFDEPVTPTAFSLKAIGTHGTAQRTPVKIDSSVVFIGRTGTKIYEAAYTADRLDYTSDDITKLVPELGEPEITRLAVQRQPDTRILAVRSDGAVMIGVYDVAETVLCWSLLETDGTVEDVVVLPADVGDEDDKVYFVVQRTINTAPVRYIEKMAQADTCVGGSLNNLADSYVQFTGPATIITGLTHLEGESVVVWADGADVGTDSNRAQTYTVSGGQITLAASATNVVVGMPYTAQWKSAKLGNQFPDGSGIGRSKNISHLGLLLADTHYQGLRFGPSFTILDEKPLLESGVAVAADTVDTDYSEDEIEFPGTWTSDMRVCLQADAPRPCTALGMAIEWDGS